MVSPNILLLLVVLLQEVPVQGTYTYDGSKVIRNSVVNDADPDSRPTALTKVYVDFNLVSVKSLDWKEQVFTASGWLTVAWTGSISWALGTDYQLELIHYFEGQVWRPELVVENSVDNSGPIVQQYLHYRGYYNGTTIWEPQTSLKVSCDMDMTYYPFDRHTCIVVLSSWSYMASEMELSPSSSVVNLDHYIENAEWELSPDPSMQASTETRIVYGETRTYSKLILKFELTRRTDAYGLLLFLPLIILSVLSILVFVLPIETGEKSGYCVAILLSIVLIFTALMDQLPSARYLPIIVVYVVLVFILASLCIVCSVFVLYLYHQHDNHEPLSPFMVSVGLFLKKVSCAGTCVCMSSDQDDWYGSHGNSTSLEEGTGNRVATPPRTLSNGHLPNGNDVLGRPLPRRKLTPIQRNRVRPKSDTSIRANACSLMSSSIPDMSLEDAITWRSIARHCNRLCFIILVGLSSMVHFVFLIVLGVGGST